MNMLTTHLSRKALTLLAFSALALPTTWAQTAMADHAAGKKKAAVCFACHGENGWSKVPNTPHLAGQQRDYLEKTLKDFRDNRRPEPTMTAMAQSLSDIDIRNVAAYFSMLGPNKP